MRSQNFRTLKFRPRTHGINGGLRELIGQSFEFAVIARVFDFHGVEGVVCRIDAPKPQGQVAEAVGSSSHLTPRWREMDSNFRFRDAHRGQRGPGDAA